MRRPSGGFTLLEIAVVLVILGMLAAIALTAFARYIRKARTSEAVINVGTLAALERGYYLAHREYLPCGPTPAAIPIEPQSWPGGDCWDRLGFRPDGPIHYQYRVTVDGSTFTALAHGDLDGDGVASTFSMQGDDVGLSGTVARDKELE